MGFSIIGGFGGLDVLVVVLLIGTAVIVGTFFLAGVKRAHDEVVDDPESDLEA